MRIAILGTRGIPNFYGGFEQFAEYLAAGLIEKGFEVIVYNSHNHPYKEATWNGVKLVHRFDPEYKLGTAGQFIYDLNCILDLRKRDCDIVLQLGYTSSSVWGKLLPDKAIVTTNMDGLEWKRTKYSKKVRQFLLYAERLGIKYSDHLISDSIGIQEYLKNKYNAGSVYIPYGAHIFDDPDFSKLKSYHIEIQNYDMLIARLEPENSIDIILEGVVLADIDKPFLVIGKHATPYGEYLKNKFRTNNNIKFIGGIYDIDMLNNLRYYSNIYFHGHTVGGTNPSLLEAMSSKALICANDNNFNRSILGDDALYFNDKNDVAELLKSTEKAQYTAYLDNNLQKIASIYSWDNIINQYAAHFEEIYKQGK